MLEGDRIGWRRWLTAMQAVVEQLLELASRPVPATSSAGVPDLPQNLNHEQCQAVLAPDHLAVVRPLQGEVPGAIERSLCRRWGIGVVLCRQSGGVTEQLWHQLTTDLGLRLLLLRRPFPPDGMECVEDVSSLMDRLERD